MTPWQHWRSLKIFVQDMEVASKYIASSKLIVPGQHLPQIFWRVIKCMNLIGRTYGSLEALFPAWKYIRAFHMKGFQTSQLCWVKAFQIPKGICSCLAISSRYERNSRAQIPVSSSARQETFSSIWFKVNPPSKKWKHELCFR